jgi:filamentous hemagglutinin family protein
MFKINDSCARRSLFINLLISTIVVPINPGIAQVIPDNTLPNNSQVKNNNENTSITGGTQAQGNLFHSFEQFSIPNKHTVDFQNSLNIQNIIVRVTGKSISNIDGKLKANGSANLFFINSNGIIFGANASLDIGGSFLASTANSLIFQDGNKFSTIPQENTSLLTVSVPIGLQFGVTTSPIINQSQTIYNDINNSSQTAVGLQVKEGNNLALIGGDLVLDGGNLTAPGGHIELGSLGGNTTVNFSSFNQDSVFTYENIQESKNIRIAARRANNLEIPSVVDVSSINGSGFVHLHGNNIELTGDGVNIISQNLGLSKSGNITINARTLSIRDAAQIVTSTLSNGDSGNLIANVSDSVELIGGKSGNFNAFVPSALISSTFAAGKAGDIEINTRRLYLRDGGAIFSGSTGIRQLPSILYIPATGRGGNLTINSSELVEIVGVSRNTYIPSNLSSSTTSFAPAGDLKINTRQLIVRDEGTISVSSQVRKNVVYQGNINNLGQAGELNINADKLSLINQGKITAESEFGKGGNISLTVRNIFLMRQNSQITTSAGAAKGGGDGGNITIHNSNGVIVAVPRENSDITANAFTGNGGNIKINTTGIYGFQFPDKENPLTSDISASSTFGVNGIIEIQTSRIKPENGLFEVPIKPTDTRFARDCRAINRDESYFYVTGKGGIPENPKQPLISNDIDVNWVDFNLVNKTDNSIHNDRNFRARDSRKRNSSQKNSNLSRETIKPATGWVMNDKNEVTLISNAGSNSNIVPNYDCEMVLGNR